MLYPDPGMSIDSGNKGNFLVFLIEDISAFVEEILLTYHHVLWIRVHSHEYTFTSQCKEDELN